LEEKENMKKIKEDKQIQEWLKFIEYRKNIIKNNTNSKKYIEEKDKINHLFDKERIETIIFGHKFINYIQPSTWEARRNNRIIDINLYNMKYKNVPKKTFKCFMEWKIKQYEKNKSI
jgi:hypothetical protein